MLNATMIRLSWWQVHLLCYISSNEHKYWAKKLKDLFQRLVIPTAFFKYRWMGCFCSFYSVLQLFGLLWLQSADTCKLPWNHLFCGHYFRISSNQSVHRWQYLRPNFCCCLGPLFVHQDRTAVILAYKYTLVALVGVLNNERVFCRL